LTTRLRANFAVGGKVRQGKIDAAPKATLHHGDESQADKAEFLHPRKPCRVDSEYTEQQVNLPKKYQALSLQVMPLDLRKHTQCLFHNQLKIQHSVVFFRQEKHLENHRPVFHLFG